MLSMKKILPLILLTGTLLACSSRQDLSGTWEFSLDPNQTLKADDPFEDTIVLPGTTGSPGPMWKRCGSPAAIPM